MIHKVWLVFGQVLVETVFAAFGGFKELFSSWQALAVIFSLLFVDFFDTAGTLMAVGNQAGLINDEGVIEGGDKH